MAQTEMMLRLLKDGKIVGYEYHRDGKIHHSEFLWYLEKNDVIASISFFYLEHDSFEFGVKDEDNWCFSGDIMEVEDSQGKTWECEIAVNPNLHLKTSSRYSIQPVKVIGNIHEEKG